MTAPTQVQAVDMLAAALGYARRGIRIFPCAPGQKTPLPGCKWKDEATCDEASIRAWWTAHPDANIGLPTGQAAVGIVIDVDDLEVLPQLGELPATRTVRTGKGLHVYVDAGAEELGNRTGALPKGVDVRGLGGYVLAPPSLHPNGTRYAWGDCRELAPIPAVWLAKIKGDRYATKDARELSLVPPVSSDGRLAAWARAIISDLASEVRGAPKGTRNETLNRAAIRAFRVAMTAELGDVEAWRVLEDAAGAAGLEKREISMTMRSAKKKADADGPADAPADRPAMAFPREISLEDHGEESGDAGESRAEERERRAQRRRDKRSQILEAAREKGLPILERGDHAELAKLVWETLTKKSGGVEPRYALGEVVAYEPSSGTWQVMSRASIGLIVEAWGGAPIVGELDEAMPRPLHVQDSTCGGVATRVQDRAEAASGQSWADEGPAGVAIGRDWVTIERGVAGWEIVTTPLVPEHRARTSLPGEFNSASSSPTWDRVLNDWWGHEDDFEDRVALLQQVFGVALMGWGPRFARALWLLGPAGSGKSVVCSLLAGLMPPGTVAALSPHRLTEAYYRAALSRARLNIAPEVPSREIVDSDAIKAIITGDPIDCRDPHGRVFTARPRALHVFAANEAPQVADNSQGFWRRAVVLEFSRRFDNANPDRHLVARILEEERAGILSWAMRGALHVAELDDYLEPRSARAAKLEWQERSNPLQAWLAERTVPEDRPDRWIAGSDVYSSFTSWCADNGHVRWSTTVFGSRLKTALPGRATKRHGVMRYGVRLLAPEELRRRGQEPSDGF